MHFKPTYLAAPLAKYNNKKVKYLHVCPGFGKTWVIIKYAVYLRSQAIKVIIVTFDNALKEQMKHALLVAGNRSILVKCGNECGQYLDDGYVLVWDK